MKSLNATVQFSKCDKNDIDKAHHDGKEQIPMKRKKSEVKHQKPRVEIDLLYSTSLIDNLFPSEIKGEFILKHFKKHPLVARGSEVCLGALKDLLFGFEIKQLVAQSASERIHVWLSHMGSENNSNPQSLDSISFDDPSQALQLYAAGHSIYCRAPLELEKTVVPRLLNDLGLGVTGSGTDKYRRGEIELFLSRKGHTTGAITNTP